MRDEKGRVFFPSSYTLVVLPFAAAVLGGLIYIQANLRRASHHEN